MSQSTPTNLQSTISRGKRVIAILGMHRSGTSAVTRGLGLLGADLGDNLMGATKGENDKGFWEDLDLYKINERVLKKLDADWQNLSEIPEKSLLAENLNNEKQDAIKLLRTKTQDTSVFAFKDPRTVNLLPFWQDIFSELELDDSYVVVVRDPRSVADSLEKRNQIPRETSYLLWLRHLNNAVKYTKNKPSVIVDYDQLLDEPYPQLKKIATLLELPPPDLTSPDFDSYSTQFLSKNLRHSQYQPDDNNPDIPDFIAQASAALSELNTEATNTLDVLSKCDKWVSACKALDLYSDILALIDKNRSRHRVELENLAGEITGLQTTVSALQQSNSDLQQKLEQEIEVKSSTRREFLNFDQSVLGRLFAITERLYLIFTFRTNQKSAYRSFIDREANKEKPGATSNQAVKKPSNRVELLLSVIHYFISHPFSSLRLISPYRIKRLLAVLVRSDLATASSWISWRFPSNPEKSSTPIIFHASQYANTETITFPSFENVSVSIVIPVFNQYETTLSCLTAIVRHTKDITYEVIIADDQSTDKTIEIENIAKNIKVIRQSTNMGFLKNCNDAAKHAKGEFIVLLNNDTNVQPNWISPLVQLLKNHKDIGLVGPKFIFEDGILQEAGGIIWQDASGWNYGRNHSPTAPEFNYVRDVDYISGACLMIRRAIWEKFGGFDERFAPAYYEDTDLAFQVREQGYRVVYQPDSVVVHFEGVSNGTDVGSGIKRYQIENQKKFLNKWEGLLERAHFANGNDIIAAKERSNTNSTVLFIDHYVPFFDKDAGSRSTFIYIKAMIDAGIKVKFLPANFFPHEPYTHTLQQLGVEVLVGEHCARTWKIWLKDACKYIDVIYLHRPHVTEEFIDFLLTLKPRPKLIYFGHDLHYLRTEREAASTGNSALLKDAKDWKTRELAIFEKVDEVFYPSEVEVEKVKKLSKNPNIFAIPLYLIDKPSVESYSHSNRRDILFVGGFSHPPNADAVTWLINEIMPLVQKKDPTIRLHIVGSNTPQSILQLETENLITHGYINDEKLEKIYSEIRLAVVPLRYGAGVKGKILEAIKAGVPIITTSIGAEGITNAESIMRTADSTIDFSEKLIDLYCNENDCKAYIQQYPDYIEKHFSRVAINKIIENHFLK